MRHDAHTYALRLDGPCYNRAKRKKHRTPDGTLCLHCGKPDTQAHIMNECQHPLLLPLRATAKAQQHSIAATLKATYQSRTISYFIEQFTYASWTTPSQQTRRIWMGMWTLDTLSSLLHPDIRLTTPMNTPERYKYRTIVRELTAPLISAYKHMIQLQLPHHTTPIQDPHLAAPLKTTRHMRLLFHNTNTNSVIPCLHNYPPHHAPTTFTYSDAAFNLTDAAIGILNEPVVF